MKFLPLVPEDLSQKHKENGVLQTSPTIFYLSYRCLRLSLHKLVFIIRLVMLVISITTIKSFNILHFKTRSTLWRS